MRQYSFLVAVALVFSLACSEEEGAGGSGVSDCHSGGAPCADGLSCVLAESGDYACVAVNDDVQLDEPSADSAIPENGCSALRSVLSGGVIEDSISLSTNCSPYFASPSGLLIDVGGVLTVEAGVHVDLSAIENNAGIVVRGTLVAQGTEEAPILFGPVGEQSTPLWGGLVFESTGSSLEHVTVLGAKNGISVRGGVTGLSLSQIRISDGQTGLRWGSESAMVAQGLFFSNLSHRGIEIMPMAEAPDVNLQELSFKNMGAGFGQGESDEPGVALYVHNSPSPRDNETPTSITITDVTADEIRGNLLILEADAVNLALGGWTVSNLITEAADPAAIRVGGNARVADDPAAIRVGGNARPRELRLVNMTFDGIQGQVIKAGLWGSGDDGAPPFDLIMENLNLVNIELGSEDPAAIRVGGNARPAQDEGPALVRLKDSQGSALSGQFLAVDLHSANVEVVGIRLDDVETRANDPAAIRVGGNARPARQFTLMDTELNNVIGNAIVADADSVRLSRVMVSDCQPPESDPAAIRVGGNARPIAEVQVDDIQLIRVGGNASPGAAAVVGLVIDGAVRTTVTNAQVEGGVAVTNPTESVEMNGVTVTQASGDGITVELESAEAIGSQKSTGVDIVIKASRVRGANRGIHVQGTQAARLSIHETLVSGNRNTGIYTTGVRVDVVSTQIYENAADGVYVEGTITLDNSLVFGNADNGVEILASTGDQVVVVNSTLDHNGWGQGGEGTGIAIRSDAELETVVVQNNIVTCSFASGVAIEGTDADVISNNVWSEDSTCAGGMTALYDLERAQAQNTSSLNPGYVQAYEPPSLDAEDENAGEMLGAAPPVDPQSPDDAQGVNYRVTDNTLLAQGGSCIDIEGVDVVRNDCASGGVPILGASDAVLAVEQPPSDIEDPAPMGGNDRVDMDSNTGITDSSEMDNAGGASGLTSGGRDGGGGQTDSAAGSGLGGAVQDGGVRWEDAAGAGQDGESGGSVSEPMGGSDDVQRQGVSGEEAVGAGTQGGQSDDSGGQFDENEPSAGQEIGPVFGGTESIDDGPLFDDRFVAEPIDDFGDLWGFNGADFVMGADFVVFLYRDNEFTNEQGVGVYDRDGGTWASAADIGIQPDHMVLDLCLEGETLAVLSQSTQISDDYTVGVYRREPHGGWSTVDTILVDYGRPTHVALSAGRLAVAYEAVPNNVYLMRYDEIADAFIRDDPSLDNPYDLMPFNDGEGLGNFIGDESGYFATTATNGPGTAPRVSVHFIPRAAQNPSVEFPAPSTDLCPDYGIAIDVDDDILAIGCPSMTGLESGRIYLHRRDPTSGAWSETPYEIESPRDDPGFGTAIAVSGEWIYVGDPGVVADALPSSGRITVIEVMPDFDGSNFTHAVAGELAGTDFGVTDLARQIEVGDANLAVSALFQNGSEQVPTMILLRDQLLGPGDDRINPIDNQPRDFAFGPPCAPSTGLNVDLTNSDWRYDINDDGRVDVHDVNLILAFIADGCVGLDNGNTNLTSALIDESTRCARRTEPDDIIAYLQAGHEIGALDIIGGVPERHNAQMIAQFVAAISEQRDYEPGIEQVLRDYYRSQGVYNESMIDEMINDQSETGLMWTGMGLPSLLIASDLLFYFSSSSNAPLACTAEENGLRDTLLDCFASPNQWVTIESKQSVFQDVKLGDFNADGLDDIAIASAEDGGQVRIHLSDQAELARSGVPIGVFDIDGIPPAQLSEECRAVGELTSDSDSYLNCGVAMVQVSPDDWIDQNFSWTVGQFASGDGQQYVNASGDGTGMMIWDNPSLGSGVVRQCATDWMVQWSDDPNLTQLARGDFNGDGFDDILRYGPRDLGVILQDVADDGTSLGFRNYGGTCDGNNDFRTGRTLFRLREPTATLDRVIVLDGVEVGPELMGDHVALFRRGSGSTHLVLLKPTVTGVTAEAHRSSQNGNGEQPSFESQGSYEVPGDVVWVSVGERFDGGDISLAVGLADGSVVFYSIMLRSDALPVIEHQFIRQPSMRAGPGEVSSQGILVDLNQDGCVDLVQNSEGEVSELWVSMGRCDDTSFDGQYRLPIPSPTGGRMTSRIIGFVAGNLDNQYGSDLVVLTDGEQGAYIHLGMSVCSPQ